MSGIQAAREFDQIAPLYDETRDPLTADTLSGLRSALESGAQGPMLEIGVGTGRVALPLAEEGITITGIDASRGMLALARAKGLGRLVRGNAYRLPIRDGSFDTAYFVHVLHVLDDPLRALQEAARVSRRRVVALVEVHERGPDVDDVADSSGPDPRTVLRRVFREAGLEPPGFNRPAERERSLLARFPADSLVPVSHQVRREPFSVRLDRMERRATRQLLHVPPAQLHEVLDRVRAEVGDRVVTRSTTYSVASWDRTRLRSSGASGAAPAAAP